MTDVTHLIDRYCRVWNEPDAARRADLLASVWASGATYTDPSVHAATARELRDRIERILGFFGPLVRDV